MKLTKENNDFGPRIFLTENDKDLGFVYGGNLDLYWTLHSSNVEKDNSFTITKENYELYRLFVELFYDLDTINIFDEEIPFYLDTEEEIREYLVRHQKYVEESKKRYRLYNHSNYNELYNPESKTITWYSDETNHNVANYLKIKQEKDTFKIEFFTQKNKDGYDDDFKSNYYIPIRFRNSGSSYDPFNMLFMKMYNNLTKLDDVNDIGHQIHIEEYLYSKFKRKH